IDLAPNEEVNDVVHKLHPLQTRASFVFPISSTVTRRLKSLVFLSQVVSLSSALLK
ncbi:hypothetical protein S245_034164, partial [Arachis hypogaea]